MADLLNGESRMAAFQGGATPGGSLPSPNGTGMQPQVDPMFSPSSVLTIPNAVKPPNGMSNDTYVSTMAPYMAKSSPMTRAMRSDQSQGTMNV